VLSEDDSPHSLLEYGAVEVEYEASSKLRHTQVRQHLGYVYPVKAFDALDLNDHAIFNDQVWSMLRDWRSLVVEGHSCSRGALRSDV